MTNKPMLSVGRELIERIVRPQMKARDETVRRRAITELRALLDNPVQPPLADLLLASAHSYVKVAGETQNLARHLQSRIEVYFDGEPAAKHQGDPVAWSYCPECGCEELHHEEGEHKQCANCHQEWFGDIDYSEVVRGNLQKLKSEQPAPVAVDDCENHKTISAAYLKLLKALGNEDMDFSEALIKAGEAVMPKCAPIAVVMPGRMKPEDNPEHPAREWVAEIYNGALDAVARLNGVKP